MKPHPVIHLGVPTVALALALCAPLVVPGSARADSIGDKNLPLLNGTTKAKHVYSVAGVRNFGDRATSFWCTSTEKTGGESILMGVEVFDGGTLENDVTAGVGVSTLTPGDTDVISTQDTQAFIEEDDLGDPTVSAGAARILATSTKVICTAFMLDAANAEPTFVTTLPVFKKTKQAGQ